MAIRKTVTLDEDVVERLELESRKRGVSLGQALNDIVRSGLPPAKAKRPGTGLKLKSRSMGWRPELNYDCIGDLLEQIEGQSHR